MNRRKGARVNNLIYLFEGFALNAERRELRQGIVEVKLEPQVFDVLLYLLRHRGRVVGKDELFHSIWKGRAVTDSALTSRINAIRRAVGDDGRAQRVIRTLPRHGFRFVGGVEERPAASNEAAVSMAPLAPPTLVHRPSVAVLPFAAIGDDAKERGIAAALAENILVALSRFRWLFVTASPGSLAGARYLVQGSVHRSGLRLRATVRLADAVGGVHLWAERFDGTTANGFELLDRAAATVAGSIGPALQLAEARGLDERPGRGETAFELHLRAQPIYSNGRDKVLRSLDLVRQAIALDPTYAPALADVAYCLQILDINGWVEDRHSNRQSAVHYARRALLFSGDAEQVATAAHVLAYFGEDFAASMGLADEAVEQNPNFARAWFTHGMIRLYAGHIDGAVASFETSTKLNPRDKVERRNIAGIAFAHFFNRCFDEAIPRLRMVVQEFPQWATPYCVLAASYAHLGHDREAKAVAGRLNSADPSLVPTAAQFRNDRHRELLAPGLKLAAR
jgi:DNA-binding winged helix-turn-helix (wHTH) protein